MREREREWERGRRRERGEGEQRRKERGTIDYCEGIVSSPSTHFTMHECICENDNLSKCACENETKM